LRLVIYKTTEESALRSLSYHRMQHREIYLAVIWVLKNFKVFKRFSEMCSPRRAGTRTPRNVEIPTCYDLIDCPMVLHISTYKFDAKNTPIAFEHVPDFFSRAPGTGSTKEHKTESNLKLVPKLQLGIT